MENFRAEKSLKHADGFASVFCDLQPLLLFSHNAQDKCLENPNQRQKKRKGKRREKNEENPVLKPQSKRQNEEIAESIASKKAG